MEVLYFPYDKHRCTIEIGSSAYVDNEIKYDHLGEISENRFIENNIWKVKNLSIEEVNVSSSVDSNTYNAEIHIHITIERKSLYAVSNLLIPAIFLSLISCISFFMPYAQALQIGMTIMLAYSVLTLRF